VASALPGLPNTSAPDATALGTLPVRPQWIRGLSMAILAVATGIGLLAIAGIGGPRPSARFRRRRSRIARRNPRVLAASLLAVLLGAAIMSAPAGELAPKASPAVARLAPGTELIGSTAVAVNPPPAPPAESFHPVAGPITPSRLRIPAIGVDTWVGAVGLRRDGSMDVPSNLWTSSWLAAGPRPGQVGNAVIAGHRGVESPALFSHLENVQPGDRVYVSDAAGNQITYVVTRVASLDLSTSTQVAVFGPTSSQQLVLITCFGRYINSARTYDHRLVVFSRPLLPA
jgi:LPXTG-site transpeptidase (sortase) family protein